MQLDSTRILIRERSLLEVMDLALMVIRQHAWPLAQLLAVGLVPMIAFNSWLLWDVVKLYVETPAAVEADNSLLIYLFMLTVLIPVQAPLVTAPMTLYLGQVLFEEDPRFRDVAKGFLKALPQLLFAQVLPRALLVLPLIGAVQTGNPGLIFVSLLTGTTLVWVLTARMYLSEIILLEKNPWRRKGKGAVGTSIRSKRLHDGHGGDLLGRWLTQVLIGTALLCSLFLSAHELRGLLTKFWEFDVGMWTWCFQLAAWLVVGYFAVVHFLSYLDLRIRTEGWEIELRLRAEGLRLSQQIA